MGPKAEPNKHTKTTKAIPTPKQGQAVTRHDSAGAGVKTERLRLAAFLVFEGLVV